MKFLILVCCFMFLNAGLCKKNYRAALFTEPQKEFDGFVYDAIIQEAAKKNIDILVLSPPQVSILDDALEQNSFRPGSFDEIVSVLSSSAKKAGIYLVSHLYHKDVTGLVQANVIFDRQGEVVTTYRKPLNSIANTTSEVGSFTSTFGVIFVVLTEEDLVLHNIGSFRNIHNYIVLGSAHVEDTGFLRTPELLSSWAYTTKANFFTKNNIYGGNVNNDTSKLLIADLNRDGAVVMNVPQVNTADLGKGYDFSKHTVKPIDIEASTLGYEETLCHEQTCCNFYVKTSFTGLAKNCFNYGFAVLNEIQSYGRHNIGVQSCVVFAYTGSYQHAFDFGPKQNKTAVKFDRIKISYNVTDANVAIFPIVISTKNVSESQFDFNTKSTNGDRRVIVEVDDLEKMAMFGIFGRNYTKDFITPVKSYKGVAWVFSNYINSSRIQECFDFLWVTLRVFLFIVSMYILEMM